MGSDALDRRIISLALPALGSLAVEPIYVLVDTAIVGRLGTPQLAGLAIAAMVLSFVVAGSNFLTYGTTERIARKSGAGDATGAANIGVQAMWLSMVVGLPLAVLLNLGSRRLCSALGASGDVLEYASTYLSISAVGVPFVLVALSAQGVLRGGSNYTSALWILLVANIANVVLEVLFVYGLDLGVAGSAWSTVICQTGAAAAFLMIVRTRLARAEIRKPSKEGMRPLLNAGRHLMLRVGSMLVVFGGATAVAARIDEPTLAAHQIVMSMFLFLALSLDALAMPAQSMVAEQLGGDDKATAARVARRATRLSMVAGLVLAAALAALAPVIPSIFTGDPLVLDRATNGLWWLAVMLIPGAVAFAYDGVLIGAADYGFLGKAAFGYLLAILPFAVFTLLVPQIGIAGVWGGLTIWMFMRAFVNHRRAVNVLAI